MIIAVSVYVLLFGPWSHLIILSTIVFFQWESEYKICLRMKGFQDHTYLT